MKSVATLACAGAVLTASPSATDQSVDLTDLLRRAGLYVVGFQRDFAMVISDETYRQRERRVQRLGSRDRTTRATRTIQSETLFLWVPEQPEWLTVRNVLKVDRKRVPDSHARLDAMLRDTTPGAADRFRRLRNESARFNIGSVLRNLGDPALPLQVIDPDHQPRFEFALDGAETVGTIIAWKLRFAERATPTMVTVDGRASPASGAIWVTASGIVLRTRLDLDDAFSHVKVTMLVTYGRDPRLARMVSDPDGRNVYQGLY